MERKPDELCGWRCLTLIAQLAVSGSTADASIVYAAPLDFVGQVNSFYNYVIPNATLVPWTSTNALFVVGFGS
jgi:hypothetical protein